MNAILTQSLVRSLRTTPVKRDRTFFRKGLGQASLKSHLGMESSQAEPLSLRPAAHRYFAVVFFVAIFVSLLPFPTYSLIQVFWVRLAGPYTSLGQADLFRQYIGPMLQLLGLGISVSVFYMIGTRIDFKSNSLSYAVVSFFGTFVGAVVVYFVSASQVGTVWETGFGYVSSFGTPDPSSFLSILTAAIGNFMVPVAGLALSSLKREESLADATASRPSLRDFILVTFIIVALALPVSVTMFQILGYVTAGTGFIIVGGPDPWRSLIPGYVGFLVYPVLLIVIFYIMGRGRSLRWRDVPRFGLWIFVAGAAGLMIGLVLNVAIADQGAVLSYLTRTNPLSHLVYLVVNGALILAVGLASVCLGIFRVGTVAATTPQTRSKFLPIVLSIVLVAMVATAGAASYAYVLNPYLNVSESTCSYQPGAALYLRIVTDQSQTPLAGQPVVAELKSLCPVITTCVGSVPCQSAPRTIRTLGSWSFVSNSTGYVSVPSRMLGGSDIWFSLAYMGHDYQAKDPICGGGVTFSQLSLPSGNLSGTEVPAGKAGPGGEMLSNGTQIITGCNPLTFTSYPTLS